MGIGGDSIIAADALLMLGRIAYFQKRYEDGDHYFEDGLQMLKRLDACEELAEQEAEYAHLLEDRGETSQALFHMRQAYESRRKMDEYARGSL